MGEYINNTIGVIYNRVINISDIFDIVESVENFDKQISIYNTETNENLSISDRYECEQIIMEEIKTNKLKYHIDVNKYENEIILALIPIVESA